METDVSKTLIVELGALVALVGYLCVSVFLKHRKTWRQHLEDSTRAREFRKHWRQAALNASSIQGRIKRVRRDYTVPLHFQARHEAYRSRLINSVRGVISRLPFFEPAKDDPPDSRQ